VIDVSAIVPSMACSENDCRHGQAEQCAHDVWLSVCSHILYCFIVVKDIALGAKV
jgi:hypothetical protein